MHEATRRRFSRHEPWYRKYQVPDLPEGELGPWRIERFEVSEDDAKFSQLRAMISSMRGRGVDAGIYTRLLRGGEVIMSDTPAEIGDHREFFHKVTFGIKAGTRVLIHGLGMGMALNAALLQPHVTHVDVIELDPQVIELVGPHYLKKFGAERVTITQGDALTWKPKPGTKWDFVWHDIWDTICADNYEEMKRLHRRFGRRCEWQGSWARDLVEMHMGR